jgi:hypothetical protein
MAGTVTPQAVHPIVTYSWNHIFTNTTTAIKTGAGILDAVVINTKGVTGNTCTLYDSPDNSGNVIAIIDTTLAQTTLVYDLAFAVGLCAITATGTAADLTITYI